MDLQSLIRETVQSMIPQQDHDEPDDLSPVEDQTPHSVEESLSNETAPEQHADESLEIGVPSSAEEHDLNIPESTDADFKTLPTEDPHQYDFSLPGEDVIPGQPNTNETVLDISEPHEEGAPPEQNTQGSVASTFSEPSYDLPVGEAARENTYELPVTTPEDRADNPLGVEQSQRHEDQILSLGKIQDHPDVDEAQQKMMDKYAAGENFAAELAKALGPDLEESREQFKSFAHDYVAQQNLLNRIIGGVT